MKINNMTVAQATSPYFRTQLNMSIGALAVVVLVSVLSGCASTVSVADLRTVNEGSAVVQARMTYEKAYRVVASESRRCFERTLPGATVTVRADLFSDSKSGEVSVAGSTLTSSIAELLFEIRAIDSSTSEIRMFYRKQSSQSVERAMRAWLEGNTTVCHA